MDELNKRVLSVMEAMKLSKSSFALALDISLPVLTHISSGRNKPGLELIQKVLSNFPSISPDWLVLGKGNMYREEQKSIDLSMELTALQDLNKKIPQMASSASQIANYHAILLKEILYLNDLAPYLRSIQSNSSYFKDEIAQIEQSIVSKLKK